jgi:hypothetical protein
MDHLADQFSTEAAADRIVAVLPARDEAPERTPISPPVTRRRFIGWSGLTLGAATALGRFVGFVPSAQALNAGVCAAYHPVQCWSSCVTACAVGTTSVCNCGPGCGFRCVCPYGVGRCGSFYGSRYCSDVFTVQACCFSCN